MLPSSIHMVAMHAWQAFPRSAGFLAPLPRPVARCCKTSVQVTVGHLRGNASPASHVPPHCHRPTHVLLCALQHIDPEEAVQIHKDVRSKRSVGMHCCTFSLTDEAMDEPPRLLKEHAAKAGLSPESFIVMRHGGLLATADGIDLAVPPQL